MHELASDYHYPVDAFVLDEAQQRFSAAVTCATASNFLL